MLRGRQLHGNMLELNSLPNWQCNKFAGRLLRTCTTVTCKSGVKASRRRDTIPPVSIECLSVKPNLWKEFQTLLKSKEQLQELASSYVEMKATIILCRKEFFDMQVETEGMMNWDLEDEQSGKRVSLQLISNSVDSSKCNSSLLVVNSW